MTTSVETALAEEARRIYRRYQLEVVEALDFCPFAERSRTDGRVRVEVMLEPVARLPPTLALVAELGADEGTDVGILVFPREHRDRLAWERFCREVRDADAERHARGGQPMAMAAFHPDAPADLSDPARLVPFTRRSPDPTLQVVRRSVLDRVRRGDASGTGFVDPAMLGTLALASAVPPRAPVHERVHAANAAAVAKLGLERLEAIFADIRADRDRSYARIAERPA